MREINNSFAVLSAETRVNPNIFYATFCSSVILGSGFKTAAMTVAVTSGCYQQYHPHTHYSAHTHLAAYSAIKRAQGVILVKMA